MSTVKLGKGYASSKELFESELGPSSPEEEAAYAEEARVQRIAEILFDLRIRRKVSREELAAKTGMSVEDICRLESDGKEVAFSDVQKITRALNYVVTFIDKDIDIVDETSYLLSNPFNAMRLEKGVADVKAGRTIAVDLDSL